MLHYDKIDFAPIIQRHDYICWNESEPFTIYVTGKNENVYTKYRDTCFTAIGKLNKTPLWHYPAHSLICTSSGLTPETRDMATASITLLPYMGRLSCFYEDYEFREIEWIDWDCNFEEHIKI